MGLQRISICGALWKLVDENEGYNVFTVRPRGWLYTAEELADLDPAALIRSFRAVIDRQRGARPVGYLCASLHGEFDEETGLYDIHLHGVADPLMLGVIDDLRHKPNYRARRRLRQRPRVIVGRQPLSRSCTHKSLAKSGVV